MTDPQGEGAKSGSASAAVGGASSPESAAADGSTAVLVALGLVALGVVSVAVYKAAA